MATPQPARATARPAQAQPTATRAAASRRHAFNNGVRDAIFGGLVALVGVALEVVGPRYMADDGLARIGGIGLIVVGAAYACWGFSNMVRHRQA